MQGEFEMSLMEELNYFLGIQIKQLNSKLFLDLKEIEFTLGPFGFTIIWAGSWFDP